MDYGLRLTAYGLRFSLLRRIVFDICGVQQPLQANAGPSSALGPRVKPPEATLRFRKQFTHIYSYVLEHHDMSDQINLI